MEYFIYDDITDLIVRLYSIPEKHAAALSIDGISDVFEDEDIISTSQIQEVLEEIRIKYNLTLEEARNIREEYETQILGTECDD